jgi:hypothetical protein
MYGITAFITPINNEGGVVHSTKQISFPLRLEPENKMQDNKDVPANDKMSQSHLDIYSLYPCPGMIPASLVQKLKE